MRTFERYVYRILIPVVVVSLIGVGVRYALLRDFVEENVRLADTPLQEANAAADQAYSVKNRDELVSALRRSKSGLDRLREESERPLSHEKSDSATTFAQQLEMSIENLATSSEDSWAQRREVALERLAAYAQSLEPTE